MPANSLAEDRGDPVQHVVGRGLLAGAGQVAGEAAAGLAHHIVEAEAWNVDRERLGIAVDDREVVEGNVAENVAVGCETEDCARRMWMQSPRHRANMMLGGCQAVASAVSASGRRY